MGVPHLAFQFGARHQGGDRVDHHDVERVRAHQHFGDLKCLLTAVRLGDQEVVDVHADLLRVLGVEGMLGVDERCGAAGALCLAGHRQGQGGLAARFRAVDLDDAAARETAGADGGVDGQRAGRDRFDTEVLLFAEAHDRALSELTFDLGERARDAFLAADLLLARIRAGGGHGFLFPHCVVLARLEVFGQRSTAFEGAAARFRRRRRRLCVAILPRDRCGGPLGRQTVQRKAGLGRYGRSATWRRTT